MRSLRLTLATGAVVAIGLVLLVLWLLLSRLFTDYVVGHYRSEMTAIVDTVAAQLALENGRITLEREPPDPRFALPAGGRYWQVSPVTGDVIRSRSLWDTIIPIDAGQSDHYESFAIAEGPDGEQILVQNQPLTLGEGPSTTRFVVQAAFARKELDDALGAFHGSLRQMLLATASVLAAAALLQGAIGLMPLRRLRERAALVRSGRERDFGTAGPSEVQPLVAEINLLLAERETAIERARARASDLAHGLKTPLTVLSSLAENLPSEDRALALQQVELIRQRADRQLQAARMGVEQMATTSVMSLGGKLVNVLRPVTGARGIDWDVDIDPALSIDVDPADLAECLGNLLDNAAKWARARIRLSAQADGASIVVAIEDDGPGIADSDRALLLRRGAQLPPQADGPAAGTGLGLAISADIAKAYGADLRLDRSPLGGLRAAVAFPAAVTPKRSRIPV
ncbi:sensor histidine kinase [Mycoplana ramosa]|uniref:histidine kinase n=1 Tax=Mycoplana ramosa TaxID=40837 RepID=A0ABW3Z0I6_MYCRA